MSSTYDKSGNISTKMLDKLRTSHSFTRFLRPAQLDQLPKAISETSFYVFLTQRPCWPKTSLHVEQNLGRPSDFSIRRLARNHLFQQWLEA
jgi:hypothetical protein